MLRNLSLLNQMHSSPTSHDSIDSPTPSLLNLFCHPGISILDSKIIHFQLSDDRDDARATVGSPFRTEAATGVISPTGAPIGTIDPEETGINYQRVAISGEELSGIQIEVNISIIPIDWVSIDCLNRLRTWGRRRKR